MLSERDIDAAHPDALDFVFGNLAAAKRADFNRHLIGCRYCQAVVDEYSEIGGIIQQLPPHVDPPAELEDRIVAAMAGLGRLRDEFGLLPVEYPTTRAAQASPAERAKDLHSAFGDPEIKAVLTNMAGKTR